MRSSQGCNMSEQPDQTENPDEYVGFNEESLYGSDVDVCFANHDIEDNVHEEPTIDNFEDNVLKQSMLNDVEDNVYEEPRINDVLQCEPSLAIDTENPRIDEFHVKVSYNKVWSGKERVPCALSSISWLATLREWRRGRVDMNIRLI
jgi:hypothetical protein